jgi:hypothetical protein
MKYQKTAKVFLSDITLGNRKKNSSLNVLILYCNNLHTRKVNSIYAPGCNFSVYKENSHQNTRLYPYYIYS